MASLFTLVGEISIKTTEADKAINATITNAQNLGTALGTAGTQADGLSQKIGSGSSFGTASVWLGNMLSTLTSKAISFASGLAGTGFEYNAQMESYTTSFAGMLGGNTEKAAQFVEQLRDLASVTPLGTSGLAGNAQTMLGFGIAADKVIGTLQMLGDVAKGDQTKLDSIVLAYSQIMAAGKMNAQDANQLLNAGVPIWDLIAKNIGKSVSETRKLSEEGAITSDVVNETLKTATSEGGLYFQQMEKQSETFNGKMSTLKDNADQTVGSLFQSFFDVAKSEVLPKLTESLSTFGEWVVANKESLQEFATTVGGAVTGAFDALISGFQWAVEHGEAVSVAIGAIAVGLTAAAVAAHPLATAITLVAGALAYLSTLSQEAHTQNELLFKDMQGYAQEEYDLVNNLIKANNEAIQGIGSWDAVDEADEKMLQNAKATELFNKYTEWKTWNPSATEGLADGMMPELPVKAKVSEESEGEVQSTVEGWNFETLASILASPDSEKELQAYLDKLGLTVPVTFVPTGAPELPTPDGEHASGLDRVPFDGYHALLHKNEMVLTASEASAYRNGYRPSAMSARNSRMNQSSDQPINITMNFSGAASDPYEIAHNVRNALELMRWQS